MNMTFAANVTGGDVFTQQVNQLLSVPPPCSADLYSSFVQILFKFTLDSHTIDERTAIALATSYNLNLTISVEGGAIPECLQRVYEFRRLCAEQYNGIADGNRCFFVANVATNWTDAFTWCRGRGAQLAQVHTASEYAKIQGLEASNRWIAAARTTDIPNDCHIPASVTYWYEDSNMFIPQLVFNNTFGRVHHCDYPNFVAGNKCGLFNSAGKMQSEICSNPSKALCQLSGPDQEYARVRDLCLAENPIETLTGTLKDCIATCRVRRWCRSFNYVGNKMCQFFTWSIEDGPKTMKTNDCVYYTYVQ